MNAAAGRAVYKRAGAATSPAERRSVRDGSVVVDNATLDDWIGQTVEVQFATREKDDKPQKTSGTLQSADERGIVLIYHDAGDRRPRPFFFPWHRIERIHRSAQRTRVWGIQRPWWRRMFGG